MSFDLRNSAQTFHRFMDEILKDFDFCFAYIDILIFRRSPQKHDQHLHILFIQLQNYGILFNPSKLVFRVPEISFLGYNISSMGSQALQERVTDFQGYPNPKTISQVRRFLGMLNFYRRLLPHAPTIQAPPHYVLSGPKIKGSHSVTCNDALVAAFTCAK